MPWSRPGGYEAAIAWMFGQLDHLGIVPTGSLEQVKNAYVSTVFRCGTEAGDVYLKMLPKIFVRELEVTEKLAEWNITKLPRWLASDATRGFILMKDMGGCDLTACCHMDLLKAAMRQFADFQIASIPFMDVESPKPFYDWRIPVLTGQIDAVVEEAPALLYGSPYQVTEEEALQLRSQLPRWKALCAEIEEAGIPDTLDHGDLRPGNIRIVGESVIFYDWAWSAITHPFMGPTGFLHVVRHALGASQNAKEALRDAYLEPWTEYAPQQELRQVFELVDRAKTLYGVVGDAEWLRSIQAALGRRVPNSTSADALTVRWRQYYFAKMLRRLLRRSR